MITKARDLIASYYVAETPTVEYTNVISAFADCESTTGWNTYQTVIAVDSANKYAGTNCLKITGQNSGSMWRSVTAAPYVDKYWLFSAYVKNNDLVTGMRLRMNNFNNVPSSDYSTATTWTRIGVFIIPSDVAPVSGGTFDLLVWVDGTANTQYGFVDNLMINEITVDDYNAGIAACLTKYPWKA